MHRMSVCNAMSVCFLCITNNAKRINNNANTHHTHHQHPHPHGRCRVRERHEAKEAFGTVNTQRKH